MVWSALSQHVGTMRNAGQNGPFHRRAKVNSHFVLLCHQGGGGTGLFAANHQFAALQESARQKLRSSFRILH